jgi:hypothetical protein
LLYYRHENELIVNKERVMDEFSKLKENPESIELSLT